MHNIDALVRARKSVRTYEERPASQDLDQLFAFLAETANPYGLPVEFKLLDGTKQKLNCPVVVGTDLFVGAKMKRAPYCNEAFGYSFELLVLCAQSLGLGTVWVGGTMDRPAFEKAMELAEDEIMPCMSPLGYPARKMSLRETMMRKGVKADERMAFEELFFGGSFDAPLTKEKAGKIAHPLEMVRLAPSAVNKQPWRVVLTDNAAHFYLKLYLSDDVDVHDTESGTRWLEISAQNGNDYAAYRLGKEYFKGDHVEQSYATAARWFGRAAQAGNQYAQYMLGKIYLMGQGVDYDKELGNYWLQQSADQGNVYADALLRRENEHLPPNVFLGINRLLHHMSRIFQNNSLPQGSVISH